MIIVHATFRLALALTALALSATFTAAQPRVGEEGGTSPAPAEQRERTADDDGGERPIVLQHFRPADQRGVNMFETPKEPGVEFSGFRVDWGAAFAAQLQALEHEHTAVPNVVNGVNINQLADIGVGFNNPTANFSLHAQLAPGVRVALTAYLSSRHHPEAWVKDGYLLVDRLPVDVAPLNALMRYMTIRLGHMEINYGDAHFRRSDNGNAVYNPFVGNYILDAFTTEIGAEVYVRSQGVLVMAGLTGGEIRGTVLSPEQRGLSYLGKVGIDRQVKPKLRVRATASVYRNGASINNTLYGGDRAGSRYYYVMENVQATESAQFTSGSLNPGFRNSVTAFQFNPFVKYGGFELFGVVERAEGRARSEPADRTWRQYAIDAVYRFLRREQLYAGVRYNTAEGALAGIPGEVGARRWQIGGGWFITRNLLAKVEYVDQRYVGFPASNIRNGGRFRGTMFEGVVAF